MNAQVVAIVDRVLRVLPAALELIHMPVVSSIVRDALSVLRPTLLAEVERALAEEPLPELLDVRPPSLAGAIEAGLREVGASPLAQTEPPPAPDTERTTEP